MRIVLALLLLAVPARADDAVFDAAGYRVARYRAPIPAPPEGVRRIEADEVRALIAGGAVVLDVTPVRPKGWDPATGRWLPTEPHANVPGTRWYPETGRGVLDPPIDGWFRRAIAAETHGDKAKTVVTYCLADCWMSWNAAKRLRVWGYTDVRWFATGADGWRDAGWPLASAVAEPVR